MQGKHNINMWDWLLLNAAENMKIDAARADVNVMQISNQDVSFIFTFHFNCHIHHIFASIISYTIINIMQSDQQSFYGTVKIAKKCFFSNNKYNNNISMAL